MRSDSYFHRVQNLTPTRVWINNPTREQARAAVKAGACGCTANPTYVSKMLEDETESKYIRGLIVQMLSEEKDDLKLLEKLQSRLVGELASIFYPVYEESGHEMGYVSIQGNPFMETKENIYRYAMVNHAMSSNITPKVPMVRSAFEAIRKLLEQGIPINITEVMSVHQYMDLHQIYKEVALDGKKMPIVFCSHIMGIFDEYLREYVTQEEIEIEKDILMQAGSCIARKLAEISFDQRSAIRWISGGARSITDFTGLVGSNMNITINWKGMFDVLLEADQQVIPLFRQPVSSMVLDRLLENVPDFRRAYMVDGLCGEEYENFGPVVKFRNSFEKGWKLALKEIAKLRAEQ